MKFKSAIEEQILATDFKVYIKKDKALSESCSLCIAPFAVFSDSANLSKMALLISFLIGIQLFHAVASVPLPHFLSPSCNSLGVNIAAEEALNKHNKYRTEGYVLGLQRIFDAQEVSEVRSPPSIDFFFLSYHSAPAFWCPIMVALMYLSREKTYKIT